MSNFKHIQQAIRYIEDHICDAISLKEIARHVNFSDYHFHRLFRSLTGYPVKEYIRNRRLYLAAMDILNETDSIVSIAQKYHFSSQSSFTVAFSRMHSCTPGEMTKKAKVPRHFGEVILTDSMLEKPKRLNKEPLLVYIDEFSVAGYSCEVYSDDINGLNNPVIDLWKEKSHVLMKMNDEPYLAVYDYDLDDLMNHGKYTYILCKRVNENYAFENMTLHQIQEGKYIKFEVSLKEIGLKDVYPYIDCMWIPKSKYILSERPDYELYYVRDNLSYVDVYISVE